MNHAAKVSETTLLASVALKRQLVPISAGSSASRTEVFCLATFSLLERHERGWGYLSVGRRKLLD